MNKPPLTPRQVNEALKEHLSVTPVHYCDPITTAFHFTAGYASGYAASPQREWVGLTEEQFLEACRLAGDGNYMVAFQRIQQWLKEKNV